MKKVLYLLILILPFFFVSCGEEEGALDSGAFERRPYLVSYADDYITPAYDSYLSAMQALDAATAAYGSGSMAIEDLRGAVLSAWKSWQFVAFLDFGPAAEAGILAQTNTYPTDPARIESNIQSESYKLSAITNYTAKGFPALDYILFSKDVHSETEKTYLSNITADMLSLAERVVADWQLYRGKFVESDGNDVGSSLGLMLNSFNQYLERDFRNGKIAIPMGWKTGGQLMPGHVEGYRSGYSDELLLAGATALKAFYSNSLEGDGDIGHGTMSLEKMIGAVGTRFQSGQLSQNVNDELKSLIDAAASLQKPVDIALYEDAATVNEIFVSTKKSVVHFKSNIPSALGVMITYQDNDGD